MKRMSKLLALVTVLVMALAACTSGIEDDKTPMADGGGEEAAMEKAETMEKDDMDDEDMDDSEHGAMDDDMKDKDDMSKDDMKDEDDMSKDGMKDEDDMSKDDMGDDMKAMNMGDPAPAFSLMNLDGETVALSDFEGRKVYVKYWASWCSICVGGLSEIDKLAGMNNDFEVITIVTPGYAGEKNAEDFKEWFATKGTENLTVLLDTDGTFAKEFGVRGFPTSAYIGSDGVLVKTAPGDVGNDKIAAAFGEIK
jgi:peptide methionine sulfoxide reductase msrA/msrB